MIKAVIYARYSSHNQREESIEGQLRECYDFANKNDFMVVGEYCDRAISGKTDNRTEFQRLMKDSEKEQFQAVIMYTLDRFARSRYDSAIYKARLKKHGVKVYYAKQSIPDTPEGIILESVLEGYAEYYSENLSRNIKRGMTENAMACKFNGSGKPLGYTINAERKFEIDPIGAKIVKEIFEMYADGKSITDIVRHCNEKGYRTAKNGLFNHNSMSRILRNEKYIGIYKHSGIVVEGGVPRIIDDELFNKVQSRITTGGKHKAKNTAKVDYLLSTKVFCGHCGANIIGESGTARNGKIHNYYKCNIRKRNHTCDKEVEKKDWLETQVVKMVVDKVLTDENIEQIAEQAVILIEKEASDKTLLIEYEERLKDVKNRIKNIIDLMEQGIATPNTKTRLLELEEMEKDLATNIEIEKMKKPLITKEQIMFWLLSFKGGNSDDINYKRKVIDTLVHSVYVYDEDDGHRKIVVNLNTTKNPVLTERFDYKGHSSTKCTVSEPLITFVTPMIFMISSIVKAPK